MKTFGTRIAAIRSERGMSQSQLGRASGLGQPRVSKIETGELAASVTVIGKLASALGRDAREIVAGTDREGYYVAEALSPDEVAKENRLREDGIAFDVLMLQQIYDRVIALFRAVYGGGYIAVNVGAEEMYLDLRARCHRVIDGSLLHFPDLYFPDHLDPIEEDDALGWEFTEIELSRSMLALKRLVHEVDPSEEARTAVMWILDEYLKVSTVDESISRIRDATSAENQKWLRRVETWARKENERFNKSQAGSKVDRSEDS